MTQASKTTSLVFHICVQYHHTPGSEISDEFITAVKIIHLADHLCKLEKIGWAGGAVCAGETEDTYSEIGLTDEARERVVTGLKAEVADTKAFFGITTTQ